MHHITLQILSDSKSLQTTVFESKFYFLKWSEVTGSQVWWLHEESDQSVYFQGWSVTTN